MHIEILNHNQIELLPLVQSFKREYILVGGTAIGLHIGHRRSIDFDLFKYSPIKPKAILSRVESFGLKYTVTRRVSEQLNILINGVKCTFFQFPFRIEAKEKFNNIARLPSLLVLASMKAYVLGRRSKWKDYVDLFFLIKNHFTLQEISKKANDLFGQLFSEKLFRAQISYFDDIDYSEPVEYLSDAVSENEIKNFLIEKAIDIFDE